jgi:hypothetical protein
MFLHSLATRRFAHIEYIMCPSLPILPDQQQTSKYLQCQDSVPSTLGTGRISNEGVDCLFNLYYRRGIAKRIRNSHRYFFLTSTLPPPVMCSGVRLRGFRLKVQS